jgi:hypothetical protein
VIGRAEAALAVAAALALAACNSFPTTCDRANGDNPPIVYKDGAAEDGVYRSAPITGPLLYFPGGIRYQIEHDLGVVPAWWIAYLSFSSDGVDAGTLAPASGNEVELEAEDAQSITLTNGECAQFWLMVVAGDGSTAAPTP